MNKENVTIYHIAEEAGVSPATVSRVLTGNATVSSEKKQKVEEVIKKYNFQPNAIARTLSKKESRTIGFILPDITNPFFSNVFLEAEKFALNAGYTLMLCDSMNNSEIELTHLRTLSEKQVDAIIFMGGRINEVKTTAQHAEEMNQILKRIPVVLVNGKMTGVDCHKVIVDEEEGILKLVEYLAKIGHRDIGILGGKIDITSTYIKHNAFTKALEIYGLEKNGDWIIPSEFSIEGGIEAMNKLLKLDRRPTAVVSINDFVAIGAIKAAKSAKLKVPDDISITGFDGTYISEVTNPQLTTVYQNYESVGKAVIDTILDIVNKKITKKTKVIKPKLIIRNSCVEKL